MPTPLVSPEIERCESRRSYLYFGREDYFGREEVWKLRKPEFSGAAAAADSLAERRSTCEREVELNSELAPAVYLGVVPVTSAGPKREFGGSGELVDWAVHMRRLRSSDRLDARIDAGHLANKAIRRLARAIAAFHERAPTSNDSEDPMDALRRLVEMQVEEGPEARDGSLAPLASAQTRQREFIAMHESLFSARQQLGRLRERHGELALEHVFIDDEDRANVIGRRELETGQRFADVCSDVASLSTELAAHGRADLAERFVAEYASQANDFDLYPLIDFYASLGASARARFEAWCASHSAPSVAAAAAGRARARRYALLSLATGHRPILPPVVVAVGGQVASGKSTAAKYIARRIGAPVVSTDRTRDFLLGSRLNEDLHELDWAHSYDADFPARVYREAFRRAAAVLESGRPVILDGCFRSAAERGAAQRLARRSGHPFLFVEARVPESLQLARLRERSQRDTEPDSTWLEIAAAMRAQWEAPDELPASEHIVLDMSGAAKSAVASLAERLPAWPRGLTG